VISKRILLNLAVFTTIAALLVGYGIVTLFGSPFDHQRTVVAELPEAGGLRVGFSASHDGVVVGTVSKIQLLKGKVRVTVKLDHGRTVPRGVRAQVVRASAVGEQRLDLASIPGGSERALPDGGRVGLAAHPIPPDVVDVLKTMTDFIDALPAKDLNIVLHELATGIDGRSDDLKAMTRSLSTISDNVVKTDHDFRRLLAAGPPVLDDFSTMSPEVHRALRNTESLTRILADRDEDLVALLKDGATFSDVADRVIVENRTNLTCLFDDVRRVSDAFQGQTLRDLARAFDINQQFFGLIDHLAVRGHAADVGYGGGARDDQLWLRTRLLVPPQTPAASSYNPPRQPRPVITGKACSNTYGKGVGATSAPTRDLGVAPGPRPAGSSPTTASPLAQATEQLKATPAVQAKDRPSSNRDLVPLFILGVGLMVAVTTTLPAARNRRRAR
jgi:phospholipid/cholesterol/gamma-HCH transport system substrate-binding protein